MYILLLLVVLVLDLLTLKVNSTEPYRINEKRGVVNLQICISSFDVHKDKIIRTQDSRDMGAKYLNEIDLGTREECLRLCCETDNCDVFVFEEKNSGSCYLFNCGPPEDFKCKFTHHVNYTSAVLTINRHLPDLESQIKLTKHEQDLAKLRKPEVVQEISPDVKIAITTTSSTKTNALTDKSKEKAEEKARKCSRYQFECRSSGECIAIYNACDGIPQCADGSDEAPELGCPEVSTSTVAADRLLNVPAANANAIRYNQNNLHRLQPPLQEMYRPPVQQENIKVPVQAEMVRQDMDFLHPLVDHKNLAYDSASQPLPSYEQHISSYHGQPNWIPHQSNQMPQMPQYGDKSVFNHKESGLQMADGQETSQNQYGEMNGNANGYNSKVSNYYDDPYRRRMPQQEQWPSGNVQDAQYGNEYMQQETKPNEWNRHNTQESIKSTAYKQPVQDHIPNWTSSNDNQKQEQDKMAHQLKHSSQADVHKSQIKIEKYEHVQHQDKYPHVVAYKVGDELQDGVVEAPSGAILSLTFGLIITCIMAILIGCRLRVVRRKMRKGGKLYAHDADYLVNGMYL